MTHDFVKIIREDFRSPVLADIDFWLATKKLGFVEEDAKKCLRLYEGFYNDPTFRREVLASLGRVSQEIIREQDALLLEGKRKNRGKEAGY